MQRLYADHSATTPLAPEVLEAMLPYLRNHFGNPSSIHFEGRDARAALDDARARMARLLGAQEGEIIFTSGATESCNTAIFGVVAGAQRSTLKSSSQKADATRPHLITTQIEHSAVLAACEQLEQRGQATVTYLPTNEQCLINPQDLQDAIRDETVLVSVMAVNNETGTIQPLSELATICRERRIPFHTDAPSKHLENNRSMSTNRR